MKGASLNPVDFEAVICTSPLDVARIAAEAWEALIGYDDPPTIFRFGGTVVRLKTSEGDEPITLETMTNDRMKHHLNRAAKWRDSENKVKNAPHSVAADMLAHPDPPLPRLKRIVSHPIYTQNKILCLTPGYSKEGEIYIHTDNDLILPEVPKIPSATDLEMAIEIVGEILIDFPFASPSDKANALAILILPFVMDLIDGPTPLHFIEAPSPGTGKTLLAFAMGNAVTGKQIPTKTECRDEDEWRRTITSGLRSSPEFYLIDNVEKRLDSAALASALSSTVWEDRLLGESKTIVLPIRTVWMGTGNNPSFSSQIARRVVPVKLDAEVQKPWLEGEKAYKHEPLLRWVKSFRSSLLWGVLTVVQSWIAKGCPEPKGLPPFGSYEEYRRVIGGILQAAGIHGFLGNLQRFYQSSDQEIQILGFFVSCWWDSFQDRGVGVNELYPMVKGTSVPLDLGKNQSEHSEKTALGKILSGLRDRRVGEYCIVQAGPKQGAQQYRLMRVENEEQKEAH